MKNFLKKLSPLFALVMALVVCCSLVACSESNDCIKGKEQSWGEIASTASCTQNGTVTYKCAWCSKEKMESQQALGHTTDAGTCSRCGKSIGKWSIGYFVDEFNNPTDHKYIRCDTVQGTFSNSATTNSKLNAYLLVNKPYTNTDWLEVEIKLFEYGNSVVKGIFSSEEYDITILDTKKVKHYLTGKIYKGDDRIGVEEVDEMLSILKQQGTISIYMESSKYSISTYLFSIETSNFYDLVDTLY